MIKTSNGDIALKGNGEELMLDLAAIIIAITNVCIRNAGMTEDEVKAAIYEIVDFIFDEEIEEVETNGK